MCGKNNDIPIKINEILGSPPRVREKQGYISAIPKRSGITPACAGKTRLVYSLLASFRDHPRVCGKNKSFIEWKTRNRGSPPRVREKLLLATAWPLVHGITPACAGKTYVQR